MTSYGYNSRGLVEGISWAVPQQSEIDEPAPVGFEYDNAGNRTEMTDGLGTVTYSYDSLSRLVAETREFTDENTGFPDDTAVLEYTYTIGGQLKSYKLPFFSNLQVSYTHDKLGRLSTAAGTSSLGNTAYASNAEYRAWGALKHLEYGNGVQMNITGFNDRLQATGFEVRKGAAQIINKTYQYYNDGLVKFEDDGVDAKFDRYYEFDHQARITKALTGAEARGSTDSNGNIPYRNLYAYDAFGHRTQVSAANFGPSPTNPPVLTYTNNRIVGADYDNEGNFLNDGISAKIFEYNAAGQIDETDVTVYDGGDHRVQKEWVKYDGDGRMARIETFDQLNEEQPDEDTTYQLRSTVLGGAIVYDGDYVNIYAGGTRIAMHYSNIAVMWNHSDLTAKSYRSTGASGTVLGDGGLGVDWDRIETDPDGKSTGFSAPVYYPLDSNDLFTPGWTFGSMVNGQYTLNVADGLHVPREYIWTRIETRHGSLGLDLLHRSSAMSTRVTVRFPNRAVYDEYEHRDLIPDNVIAGLRQGELFAHYTFPDWWAINLISWQTQQTEPIPNKEDLRKLLTRRQDVNKGECRKFLEDVLKNLKIKGSFEDLFDDFAKKRGFTETGTGHGLSDMKGGDIGLPTLSAAKNDAEKYVRQMRFVGVIIHELLHRKGKSHSDMARAGFRALSPFEQQAFNASGDDSTDFSRMVNQKCKFNPDDATEVKANVIP